MTRSTFRRRSLGVVAGVALSALFLAGCSGDAGSNEPISGEVPDEETTLTVWSFLPGNYDDGAAAYEAIETAFNAKYPQVTVDVIDMPYPTYFDQVRNATVAQKGPDVITMYGGSQAYSYKNGLMPLQDVIEPEVEENLNFIGDNYSPDGNLYILPTGTYGYAMMVNKDEFAKAGLDPVDGLKDWPSFLSSCEALSAKGVLPIATGWQDGYLFETFMYMISSQMMDTATMSEWTGGKIPVDDEMFQQATSYIMDMKAAGCFGGDEGLGRAMYDDAFNQYYAGQAAMFPTGSLSTAGRAAELIPSTSIMPLPQVPASKHDAMIDAGAEAGWAVTKWTKSPEAAVAFANFMAGPEAQQLLWDAVGVPPNLKNLKVEGTSDIQKEYLPLMQNPENHTGFASFPLTVLAVFERNAAPLMGGTMTEEEFLAQAQSAFAKSE